MPWTTKDVDSKKKGLTPAQKAKWVKIANSVLAECQAKKGKDCEGKAVRIANSKFGEGFSMKESIPKGALHFHDYDGFANVKVTGEGKPKLDMVFYSGGVIKNHFWWGNLAFDVDGMKFPKSKFPILEAHMTTMKIGFSDKKPVRDGNALKVDPDAVTFLDTPEAAQFIKNSQAGFPYEASWYGIPLKIQRLSDEKEEAEVNGFKLRGPATIWRECLFKEASVCVFGYDSNTKSAAFDHKEELEIEYQADNSGFAASGDDGQTGQTSEGEVTEMKVEELKSQHPELVTQLKAEFETELKAKFDQEKTELSTKHSKEVGDLRDKVLVLEKENLIRRERELKLDAERVFSGLFGNSDIPERMKDKVWDQVRYDRFIKDGALDLEAFTKAVNDELADWTSRGATASAIGTGFTLKDTDDSEAKKLKMQQDEDARAVAELAALAGQPVAAKTS